MADYIEREAFKQEVRRLSTHYLNEWDTLGVLAAADRIPAADVREVKRGKWKDKRLDKFRKYEVVCSECGAKYIGNYDAYDEPYDFNFCPNCGCAMGVDN